jgi:hypothetical protein
VNFSYGLLGTSLGRQFRALRTPLWAPMTIGLSNKEHRYWRTRRHWSLGGYWHNRVVHFLTADPLVALAGVGAAGDRYDAVPVPDRSGPAPDCGGSAALVCEVGRGRPR